MGKEWLLNGPLKPILNLTDFDPSARLPPEIEKFLIQFHTYNSLSTDSSTLRDQFSVAIGLLHRSFIFVLDDIRDHKAVLAFPILLAPEVKAEMGRGNELALVILMCYSLVLHLMGRSIWLEGLGRGVVFAIAKRLEGVEEWEDVVFWAVREAGKDNLLKREEDTNRGIAKTGEKVGRDVRMA